MSTRLTKSEQEIMALFWSVDHPMTQADVVSSCESHTWKERSVFSFLNSLLKKGLIHEVNFVRSGKSYARTFEATMSRAEYFAEAVSEALTSEEYVMFLIALLQRTKNQENLQAAMRQALVDQGGLEE